jgi:membrane-bound lytic murein transglycosylase B
LPGTWAAFGVDANGDGRRDPFDPADAIVSQGNYMCFLVGQMGAGVTWTTLLWAYNAGPEATKASAPNAPTAEARDYASRILNQLLSKYVP